MTAAVSLHLDGGNQDAGRWPVLAEGGRVFGGPGCEGPGGVPGHVGDGAGDCLVGAGAHLGRELQQPLTAGKRAEAGGAQPV